MHQQLNLGRDNVTEGSELYADAGRILFYNDQLWVVKYNSKELIGIDKDTLVANGKTLPFDNLSTSIKDAKFNDLIICLLFMEQIIIFIILILT